MKYRFRKQFETTVLTDEGSGGDCEECDEYDARHVVMKAHVTPNRPLD